MKQQLQWDNDKCLLVTQFDDGRILSEPITLKEAAKWESENKW